MTESGLLQTALASRISPCDGSKVKRLTKSDSRARQYGAGGLREVSSSEHACKRGFSHQRAQVIREETEMAVPKRVADRIKLGLRTFRRILEDARNADRSEQDTVTIVTDMLADIFGYNKYSELTGEYAIRGTYCDLAVKIDGKVKYLIEVKAVDKSLKENHLRQATDYAAKEGIEWVTLTNGIQWQAYRMIFEQPVRFEHVFTIDLLEGGSELPEMIYMLCREGIAKQALV